MEYSSFPVLVIDDDLKADTAAGRAARAVVAELKEHGLSVIEAATYADGEMVLDSNPGIGCLMLEWGCNGSENDGEAKSERMITELLRERMVARNFTATERSVFCDAAT